MALKRRKIGLCAQCGVEAELRLVGTCEKCYRKKYENERKLGLRNKKKFGKPSEKVVGKCPQCSEEKLLMVQKKICSLCNSKNYYINNKEKVLERTGKRGREKTRRRRGIPLDSPPLIGKPGSGSIEKKGNRYYKVITKPGHPNARVCPKNHCHGRIYEHTYIMSNHLGRPLRKGESVHHKNGEGLDNRIENLELWYRGQPAGQRVEDKIAWCKEFLSHYGYTVSHSAVNHIGKPNKMVNTRWK